MLLVACPVRRIRTNPEASRAQQDRSMTSGRCRCSQDKRAGGCPGHSDWAVRGKISVAKWESFRQSSTRSSALSSVEMMALYVGLPSSSTMYSPFPCPVADTAAMSFPLIPEASSTRWIAVTFERHKASMSRSVNPGPGVWSGT